MGKFLHFGYGSNMDMKEFKEYFREKGHDPSSIIVVGKGILRDYELAFNYYSEGRKSGAANIMVKPGAHVEGLILEMGEDLRKPLRAKEGWPNNYREIEGIKVEKEDGSIILCMTYEVVDTKRNDHHIPPSEYYMGLIKKAANDYNFSDEYIKMLEGIKTKEEDNVSKPNTIRDSSD